MPTPIAVSNAASWGKDKTVVLIGTGQLARAMGPALHQKGIPVTQVFGRDVHKTQALAEACGAEAISDWTQMAKGASLYLLAVSESAIPTLSQQIPFAVDSWVLHCSGVVPVQPLAAKSGVIWPVQMFGGGEAHWGDPLLGVEAFQSQDLAELVALAALLSSRVKTMTGAERQEMHLMATWVANFSNHLYHLADRYLQEKGLRLEPLHGIIAQTALALSYQSPAAGQAGPAWRKSIPTLELHRALLKDHPVLLDWYNRFSQSIAETRDGEPFTTQGKSNSPAE